MNLKKERLALIHLLRLYLNNQISYQPLYEFAWRVIDYFTKNKSEVSSLEQEAEKVFWYAIWQIQHLADEDHSNEGITRRNLADVLSYLIKDKPLPEDCFGRRP